jgi:L-ascorbate metabolism protein UlaG (beta-lactamase superfamily)
VTAEVSRALPDSSRAKPRPVVRTVLLAAERWLLLRPLHCAPAELGAEPDLIRAAAERSPNCRDGVFANLDPSSSTARRQFVRLCAQLARSTAGGTHEECRPPQPVPLTASDIHPDYTSELAVSWLGHSTALLEIDGHRVLTDPVWSDRCSPSKIGAGERLHPPPVQLDGLPPVDAVVISHDHYDHLDHGTVLALVQSQPAPFLVPAGVGAHLRAWGVPETRIVELDWNQSFQVGKLAVTCVPARHFSGRTWSRRDTTQWASWAFAGPSHRAYFGGDTGYTKSFAQIGADYGPFDVTLMPVGAYNSAWPDVHMNPEEAVRAHLDVTDVGSGLLVPIHWGTFRLAPHPWSEPIERLLTAARPAHVQVAVPTPGQRIDPAEPLQFDPWWRFDTPSPRPAH